MDNRTASTVVLIAALLPAAIPARADDPIVDKIYDPYVNLLERETEYRVIAQNDNDNTKDGLQIHRLGLGMTWADHWFSELYLLGEKTDTNSLSVSGYELETKWQMTEKGEYWADWGMLFEFETKRESDISEYKTTLLMSKELGRWVNTVNAGLLYEWGNDVVNEWETTLTIQSRYRLTRGFEPALELYAGEYSNGLGPVLTGNIRTGGKTKLHWEAGVILGLDSSSVNQTYRGLLEFEF